MCGERMEILKLCQCGCGVDRVCLDTHLRPQTIGTARSLPIVNTVKPFEEEREDRWDEAVPHKEEEEEVLG